MKETMEFLAKKLVDKPEEVSVKAFVSDNVTVIEITVAKTDIGKLIGKKGETAEILRKILYRVASKEKQRCVLQINQ